MTAWPAVLDELVERRRPALVGYAYIYTGDVAAAEDLVHDAILRTFSKPRGLVAVPQAEAYVRRAIATIFVNGTRRHRRFVERMHLLAVPESSGAPDAAPGHDEVHRALMGLSPRERACAVLRFYEDLPVAGVADALGISIGAAKRYLSDAASKLRVQLGAHVDEDADDRSMTVDGPRDTGRRRG